MTTMRFHLCLVFVLCLSPSALADENTVIAAWYSALMESDRGGFGDLLRDDALIVLEDLGIEQTKAEFIAALDEWEAAAGDAAIRYRRIEGGEDGMIAVAVCYDFPENRLLTREEFALEDEKVVKSVQTSVSDDCGDL